MASSYDGLSVLNAAIDNTPLIDNHAHPLLTAESVAQHPLLSIATEASGDALNDSKASLAHVRAVKQLADVFGCEKTWEAVVASVEQKRLHSRDDWIKRCLEGIETILIDDGLGVPDKAEHFSWHSKFTKSECKRIVRIETVASDILAKRYVSTNTVNLDAFMNDFEAEMAQSIADPEVVGFKSIVCYRGGLDIPPWDETHKDRESSERCLEDIVGAGLIAGSEVSAFSLKKRLEHTTLNHLIVHVAARFIQDTEGHKKPIQFHTGLGDNDITLTKSSPSHLQPFIREYPTVPIVLLHAGYPWTRETAYLAAMYPNVYADIGEVFPCISRQGQEGVLKQMLELCPWSKIICSTDGHGVPEMYLIATTQIRSVLKTVLGELVKSRQLDEKQAVQLVQNILFSNSKKLYNLHAESVLPTFAPLETVPRAIPTHLATAPNKDWGNEAAIQKLQSLNAKYLRVYWHDYTSSARCRLLPVKQVYKTLASGKPLTVNVAKVGLGLLQTDVMIPQVNGTGMYVLCPDWASLKAGPAAGHASCFGNFVNLDGSAEMLCPRTLLQSTLDKAAAQGLTFLMGFEVEFIVLERDDDPNSPEKYRTLRNDGHAWSMARVLADWGREGSFSTAADEILDGLEAAGIEYEQFHPESAPGQYELVLAPLPPLEACDSVLHARQILESVAARHGYRVTLHPKPFAARCGSASHVHMSISSAGGDNPEVYEAFYAGILQHFRAVIPFAYSNPTSYERMVDSFWAGGRWVTWGTQNKEAPLRKIAGSHWELKTLDGIANPYLAMAVLFTAGTKGVREKTPLTLTDFGGDPARLTPEERSKLGITTMFPADLKEGLQALREDEDLGLDPRFVQRYIDVKNAEMQILLDPLSPEERRRWVLERY